MSTNEIIFIVVASIIVLALIGLISAMVWNYYETDKNMPNPKKSYDAIMQVGKTFIEETLDGHYRLLVYRHMTGDIHDFENHPRAVFKWFRYENYYDRETAVTDQYKVMTQYRQMMRDTILQQSKFPTFSETQMKEFDQQTLKMEASL